MVDNISVGLPAIWDDKDWKTGDMETCGWTYENGHKVRSLWSTLKSTHHGRDIKQLKRKGLGQMMLDSPCHWVLVQRSYYLFFDIRNEEGHQHGLDVQGFSSCAVADCATSPHLRWILNSARTPTTENRNQMVGDKSVILEHSTLDRQRPLEEEQCTKLNSRTSQRS